MLRKLTEADFDLCELIDIDEFIGQVVEGEIGDQDGEARLVFEDEVELKEVPPSEVAFYMNVPDSVTHVLWFQFS